MKIQPSFLKKIFLVGGARPNFVKIAALCNAFSRFKKSRPRSRMTYSVINTGQHYDFLMSKKFFQDLEIPDPCLDLGIGSSTHADQTARVMSRFEKVLFRERPDLIIVVGDVNSTLASSLVAAKMAIPVAHVEAGLRSFDRSMPEEINRLVTDALSEFLFTTCEDANKNLRREGIPDRKIFFVGNVMVDTLLANLSKRGNSDVRNRFGLRGDYAVLTLHRPSNVDQKRDFEEILEALEHIQKRIPIVFPVHPRTADSIKRGAVGRKLSRLADLHLMPPMGYLDFIALMRKAKLVLTDSGGIQEETTVLKVPCITVRDNTERPVTIREGTNFLGGRNSRNIIRLADRILNGKSKKKVRRPSLWDGRSADRIVKILSRKFGF